MSRLSGAGHLRRVDSKCKQPRVTHSSTRRVNVRKQILKACDGGLITSVERRVDGINSHGPAASDPHPVMLGLLLALLPAVCSGASVLTSRDVVNKNTVEFETTLEASDFDNDLHSRFQLHNLGIKVKDDPTMGNYSEGDIALESPKKFAEDNNQLSRNAIRQAYRRWPNAEIPYTLSSQYGAYARSVIANAMKEYHTKTCVKFVARDPARHPDYLYIHPDDGCYSLVGKTGGKQPVSLDSGCIQVGTIVHELMHAVGFFHEQSRQDRDSFVEIVWRNVVNGADDQFEKYNLNVISHLDEPYDFSSIMHYGPYAFSGSGKKTIVPRQGGAERMGQRVAFSNIDVRKINKLYQCNNNNNNNKNNNNNNNQQISTNQITSQQQPQVSKVATNRRIMIFG
ncbi:unnamed protein product [Caenorhabditis auriculariae]|uniref:Metalloendopeptidase n=1 Tax=Caenorhabditis auriculariae TaxID=2777116 RepID=A0A8S1GXV9_9PELO|nr:unnamed protein product [Caenorhabditis auriculariae]